MALLDKETFLATFASAKKMVRISPEGPPPFSFWPYFDQIPKEDFQGYDCSEGIVRWVWRGDDQRFEYIHISTKEDADVFMVIVLDLMNKKVAGHRLMDFKSEYGLRAS